MASSHSRKEQSTVAKRMEILQRLEEGATVNQLISEYGLSRATIYRYQRNAVAIRQAAENRRRNLRKKPSLVHDVVDTRLRGWVSMRQALGDTLTDSILQEKARELHERFGGPSNFMASRGWLRSFKDRHGVHTASISRETNANELDKFEENLLNMLAAENVDEENVYNINETSVMWKVLPQKILAREGERFLDCKNLRKDRVTVALCANATGTHKLLPLFVYKYNNPRALKHCKHDLPVVYKSQRNGRMDEYLFNDWYDNYFKPSVIQRQRQEHREGKVVLMVEKCMLFEKAQEDPYFKLIYLPPGSTVTIRPVDQNVVTKCKQIFRNKLLLRALQHAHGVRRFYAEYDIKDCMDLISGAWDVITSENINSSWRKLMHRSRLDADPETQDQDCLELIRESIPLVGVTEWQEQCEAEEGTWLETETDGPFDPSGMGEVETEQMFRDLAIWAETKSDNIRLHANVLIDYYNQKH
ncbi:jerky protein homolog-like [Hylaeus anthracinus]|uniref:jerky protein homolog-like n=1 Tax=Hylaeus anthracinus TaxID=313031 RepID=UPI0023B96C24|nr:jerky protein homolog-like [Hylaeus anthracinus]XP_054003120.1 jerky protein homolog-like [Hylaeus anthracinus]